MNISTKSISRPFYSALLTAGLLLFSGLLVAQEQPTFTQFEAYSALVAGRAKYEQGEYLTALRNFDRVVALITQYPEVKFAEVYLDRGNTLFALGRYNEAITDYSEGISQSTRRVLTREVEDIRAGESDLSYQSVKIIDLDRNPDLERENALLYHNRGVANYYLGKYKEATADFEFAHTLAPDMPEAERNLESARLANGRNRFYEDTPIASNTRSASPGQPIEEKKSAGIFERIFGKKESVTRGEETLVTPSRINPVTSRYPRTRYFGEPTVAGQSFDYVLIESIEVTAQSTLVNMRVSNLTREAFPVRLFSPGSPSAFLITDRTRTRTYRLKSIQGLPMYPQSVQLKPNTAVSFTLEFEPLPEGVGYIHLLEGNTQQGKEWNFYDVKLE